MKKKRRKKAVSAVQRTLAVLKRDGYTVGITEKWNPFVGIRQDLFGFIDLLAIREGYVLRAVNATTASEISRHVEKYLANPRLKTWLSVAGAPRFELWAWRRLKATEKGKRVDWKPRIFIFHRDCHGEVKCAEQ